MDNNICICAGCGGRLPLNEITESGDEFGHVVPERDNDGDVCGCRLCGPCRVDPELAAARIAELEERIDDYRTAATADRNIKIRQREQLDKLKLQLAAAQERERWVPVTERLPEYEQIVETKINGGYGYDVMQNDGGRHFLDGDGNCWGPEYVTHWRELPERHM